MLSRNLARPSLSTLRLVVLWTVTAAGVTMLDLLTSAGVGVSAAFIILVLTALYAPWPRTALVLAAVASVLVVAVYAVAPPPDWQLLADVPVINHAITVVLLWVTAALVVRHKTIERQLADTRARFKETFEQTAVGIAHVALDGSWIGVNGCFARILGYEDAADLADTDLIRITHPDDAGVTLDSMHRLRLGEQTMCAQDKRCVRKDGTQVWVHETMSLGGTRASGGSPYFLCIIQNIGERKQTEQRLMQLKAAVDAANDAVVVLTPARGATTATVDYVNAAFRRMFGYEPSDLIGRSPDLLLDITGDRTLVNALCEPASPDLPLRRELIGRARDGTDVVADWHVADVRDETGRPRHRIAIARDIAETHRYERALEASERRARRQLVELELLYHTAPIGLAMVSPDMRFVRVNERLAQMNGVPASEHVGRTPAEIVPALAGEFDALLHRVLDAHEPVLDVELHGETRRTPGDNRVWREQFYPVLLDSRIEGVGVVVEDITEQRRGEDHLRLVMRELNHRVKNSLAVVQSIASQTVRTSTSLKDFEQALIGRIRALAETHTLLTESNWHSAALRQILRQTLRPYRTGEQSRATFTGEDIALSPSASLALSMVLHELTTNAVKYGALAHPGGRIAVDWRLVGEDGSRALLLRWVETGAAPEAPGREGFGSRLIDFTIRHEFDGRVRTSYGRDGLTCEMSIPWNRLALADQPAGIVS